jgi:hypothetical protein
MSVREAITRQVANSVGEALRQLGCAGYLVHLFRNRSFEKRSPKEKRGVHDKRERAWFLGEGCRVGVRKCSRSCLRGARHGNTA